jgi:zona occludens toxin
VLTMISGLPGSSKTLNAIALIDGYRVKDPSRPVYYWNVGDVTVPGFLPMGDPATFDLPGVEPDPSVVQKWFELPTGSIILIDECQKLWRKRGQGAAVPDYVSRLETHRKQGYDLIGLTQHPKLVDADVRKLVGQHIHYRRIFGSETFHSWEWQEVQSEPESRSSQVLAREVRGRFPKKYYGTYRSAEVHNVKKNLPWKWIATIGAAVVLCPLLGWGSIAYLRHSQTKDAVAKEGVADVRTVKAKPAVEVNPWDARLHAARVHGFEASAPFYDRLIKPVSFPKITGCMQLAVGLSVQCECTSQQGTVLDMPVSQCVQFVKRGWFDFTKPDAGGRGPSGQPDLSLSSGSPAEPAPVSSGAKG